MAEKPGSDAPIGAAARLKDAISGQAEIGWRGGAGAYELAGIGLIGLGLLTIDGRIFRLMGARISRRGQRRPERRAK